MNDVERVRLITATINMFREIGGLDWLLQQVAETIRDQDSSDLAFDDILRVLMEYEDKATVLNALLDAIQYGILDRIAIRQAVDDFFTTRNMTYSFASDVLDGQETSEIMSTNSVEGFQSFPLQLEQTLREIRRLSTSD